MCFIQADAIQSLFGLYEMSIYFASWCGSKGGGIYREEGNANTSVFKKKIHVHISTMYMYLHLKYYTFNCIYYVLH